MKTYQLLFVVGLLALGTGSCRKETSIEHGGGQAADMVATIDGLSWQAADSTESAIFSQGLVTISGISGDGREISITLNDTVVGAYLLNQGTTSLAIYADLDSVGSYAFSTNQGTDTSQAGGTVTVTAVDRINRTISGVFSFKVFRNSDDIQKIITDGVFYNMPFSEQ
jgi:hypothetical protein